MANQYTKKKLISQQNKKEIFYNIINALLAGGISFFSALLATGELNFKVVVIAFITSALVAIVKFKNYWDGEKKEYQTKIFKFL